MAEKKSIPLICEQMYSTEEIDKIIQGYRLLDVTGMLSHLLESASKCRKCIYPEKGNLATPINCLVRPLPLHRLTTASKIRKYTIRIKRDDTFLRNTFRDCATAEEAKENINSAKFSIGLLPWLDRCMLLRENEETNLMIVGIDYKNFPVFFSQSKDHNFPLDSYHKKNNIWGATWRKFWANLLGGSYDESVVNHLIAALGLYITNSMLCFGGSKSARTHNFEHISRCRSYIKDQIKIVSPNVLVSFGNAGCKNVASILLEQNEKNIFLKRLSSSSRPLQEMVRLSKDAVCKDGIGVEYNSLPMSFWPLNQPGWSHVNRRTGEYAVLRSLLRLKWQADLQLWSL